VPTCEEVLLRVLAAGVCHTDLHIIDGAMPHLPLPRVLGHEITGETDELGPVVVYASWGCGECLLCRRGEEQLCPHAAEAGWVRDGGYAEFGDGVRSCVTTPGDGVRRRGQVLHYDIPSFSKARSRRLIVA